MPKPCKGDIYIETPNPTTTSPSGATCIEIGELPETVSDAIHQIKDQEPLRLLHRQAVRCESLTEFQSILNQWVWSQMEERNGGMDEVSAPVSPFFQSIRFIAHHGMPPIGHDNSSSSG